MTEDNYIAKFPSAEGDPWCRSITESSIFYKGGLKKENAIKSDYIKPSWYSTKDVAEAYNEDTGGIIAQYKTTKEILLLDIRSKAFHEVLTKIIGKLQNPTNKKIHDLLNDKLWRSSIQFDMTFPEQFNYLSTRYPNDTNFVTQHQSGITIKQSLQLLDGRIKNFKKSNFCVCDQYADVSFLPQRYSRDNGDKQLVLVLNYLFGKKYQGYIAGKWFTVLYGVVNCFHEEICIFNPSSCMQFVDEQGGGNNSLACNTKIKNDVINDKIYEYSDKEFNKLEEFPPLEDTLINDLINANKKGGSGLSLKNHTKVQLYEKAKALHIKNRSKMNKSQLFKAVRKAS
jgi:hypothetical protein